MPRQGREMALIDRQAVGLRLRLSREEAGISVPAAATEMRVTRHAVYAWESGRTVCDYVQLAEMALLYGKSADFILFGIKADAVKSIFRSK
jgi:transcriptional regulator with XRE-family HTH domain